MKLTKREFLQLSGGTIGALLLSQTKAPLRFADETFYFDKKVVPDSWKKGVCRYCGTGCGVEVGVKGGKVVAIRGNKNYPVNKGLLCLKGLSLMHVVHSDERATKPYVKKDGKFVEISMDSALDLVADKIKKTVQEYGPDSVALYVGAQIFTEEMFVGNKLFKGLIGTNNVEANARLCMASAVTGFLTTFGSDEPASGYHDIEKSDCFFLIGTNTAEQHPILFARILKRKAENKNVKIIVADPRFTATAAHADLWLPFFPGTDLALLNSMAYVIVNENLIDRDFIEKHTTFAEGGGPWGEQKKLNFDEFKKFLEDYKPKDVAEKVGVEKEKIIEAARLFANSKSAVTMWTMGFNQRKWGTWVNNLGYNLHLLTGKICKPGSTAISLTGQPNACGGVREQGMLAHLLPGHRKVAVPKYREDMEKIWDIPKGSISPNPGPHTMKMFDQLGDKIKLIWIVCSNPAQTLPNLNKFFPKLEKAFVIVQDIFPPTQVQSNKFANVTAEFADVFLPSAFWIEKGGVFGNTERRSALTEKIVEPPEGLLADWEIFVEVAKKMGYEKEFKKYTDMEIIWDEYRLATKGRDVDLFGADYEFLRKNESAQWPVLSSEEGDTKNRYIFPEDKYLKNLVDTGRVKLPDDKIYFYGKKDGKAIIFKRPQKDPEEIPDSEYPFYLTTGRVVHHWHTGTMTMRVPWLKKMVGKAFIEINIEDAKKKNIKNGDNVKVVSRRGELVLEAKIVDTSDGKKKGVQERVTIPRPGVVFIPFFDAEKLANVLCVDGYDDMSKEPEYKICAVQIEGVKDA